jgi:hypothetical protein
MAVVAAGDHCQDCANKAAEIVKWVEQALQLVNELQKGKGEAFPDPRYVDQWLVTFAFTRQGAQGIANVITALQNAYGNSPIPIIVSWVNNQGGVSYTCIGSQAACAQVINSGQAARIACNQQGFAGNCLASEFDLVGGNKFAWMYQPPSVITGYMDPWKAGYVPECGDHPAWDFLCY